MNDDSPNHSFQQLPFRLILDILNEWVLLDVPIDRFRRELQSGECMFPNDISDVCHDSIIDENEPLVSKKSIMDQSDYFGYFVKDPTRTVFQLFASLCVNFRRAVAHADWPREWYDYFTDDIHRYFPLRVRFLDLTETEEMGNPRIYEPLLHLIPQLQGVRGIILSKYATYEISVGRTCRFGPIPYPKSLERLAIPFYMCSCPRIISLTVPNQERYLQTLRTLPARCKLQLYWTNSDARMTDQIREWEQSLRFRCPFGELDLLDKIEILKPKKYIYYHKRVVSWIRKWVDSDEYKKMF